MTVDLGQLGTSRLKVVAAVVGVLVVILVGAVALGVLGTPTVEAVENRFGNVSNDTTVVHTDLIVHNPNPVGARLSDARINYTVRMNDVAMARGGGAGLIIRPGNSTLAFQTQMDNGRIPTWWQRHVNDGERTVVSINATVQTSALGKRAFDVTQEREVETDIIGQFDSNETRPIELDDPPPTTSNPLLYVNRTSAEWGEATEQTTPIDVRFDVFNPQLEPYIFTEIGYEMTMNGILVGEGRSSDQYVIPGGATKTLETRTSIQNQRLDEWWVTHLQNDQVTDLRIDFYARLELPTGNTIRIPLDPLTAEETIETDIFGTKNQSGTTGTDDGATSTASNGGGTSTPTSDETTSTSGSGDETTPTSDDGSTPTPTTVDEPTPTPTSDDGFGF